MFTVYILINLTKTRTYVGYTEDIQKRLKEHNAGHVNATKSYGPWNIISTESCSALKQTKQRELYWKSASGRRNIARIIKGFPPRFRKRGEARLE